MCGIVGVAGTMGLAEKSALRQMAMVDSLRGFDSTGLVRVNAQDEVESFKQVGDGIHFLNFIKSDKMIDNGGKVLLIHNRWATKGKVNNINAHPFTHGDITGVHNGTLVNQALLPDHKSFEVDSENVFHSFNKIGVEETIKKLHGAYALVWYNDKDSTLNMVRNNERPLSYCYSLDGKTLFWASESKMLEWILFRNKINHKAITMLPAHKLLTVKIPKSYEKIEDISLKEVTPHSFPVRRSNHKHNKNVSRLPYTGTPKELEALYGKEYEFQVDEFYKNAIAQNYIKLLPLEDIEVNGKDLDVIVFVGQDSPMKTKLLKAKKDGGFIKGTLSQFTDNSRNPSYITVTHKSIEVIKEADLKEVKDGDPEFFLGFDNAFLDKKEWEEATKDGCYCCTGKADPDVFNEFLSQDTFVCPDCYETPELSLIIDMRREKLKNAI